MTQILVTKRGGRKEPLDLEKLHKVVFWATEGITGVSASQVEIKSHIQFYPGIKTADIQDMQLAQSQDGNDNLVLINQGKYILNWAWGEMLNISSEHISIRRTLEANVVTKNIH